jgi:hypothetical protein
LASTAIGGALIAAIAVILLASNSTIINAQQSLTSQSEEIGNGTIATFQSTNDSFSIQVPDGWTIQDLNNTGSALLEETRRGYGVLAQLCTEEEEQQGAAALSTNARGSTNNSRSNNASCQGTQAELVYIIRYPDLNTRLQVASNTTAAASSNNNNTTTDKVLSYHMQKIQEVGYRDIQFLNSTDMRLNLTDPQTNQTIATAPAKLVEMTYSTASAPNETRIGYFILTATNATPPNLGTLKGYSVFYEGRSFAAATTTTSESLLPPTPVRQVFDSFELIVAPEVAQAIAQQEAQAAEIAEGGGDEDGDNGGEDGDGDDADNGDNGDGGNDGRDGNEDGDNGGEDGDGDDANGEGGRGLAERIIEETEAMVERIIGETG